MEYYMNKDGQMASKTTWEIKISYKNARTGGELSFDDAVALGMLTFLEEREEEEEIKEKIALDVEEFEFLTTKFYETKGKYIVKIVTYNYEPIFRSNNLRECIKVANLACLIYKEGKDNLLKIIVVNNIENELIFMCSKYEYKE